MNSKFLENNPIFVSKDSNQIKLYYKNHNLKVGEQIVLKKIQNNDINIKEYIYLNIGFDYFLIKTPENHNLLDTYNDLFKLNIIVDDNIDTNDRMIGNIPLNSLIGIHKIYILKENDPKIGQDILII